MQVLIKGRVYRVKLSNCLIKPHEIAQVLNETEGTQLQDVVWNLEEDRAISLKELIKHYFSHIK